MTTFEQLVAMAPGIYSANAKNGFWPINPRERNPAEVIALINSELYEALEAHRKNHTVQINMPDAIAWLELHKDTVVDNHKAVTWNNWFQNYVKDTVSDELADTAIRILDALGGYGIKLQEEYMGMYTELSAINTFAGQILYCNGFVSNCYASTVENIAEDFESDDVLENNWNTALCSVINLAEVLGIDLLTHVQWKLRYNESRGKLHGNKTY